MTGIYNITRPEGSQIKFLSSTTGEHDLDDYLEQAEKGGRELGALMGALFDAAGVLRNVVYGVRVAPDTRELQVKSGTSAETSAWTNTGVFMFRFRGAWAATDYAVTDYVTSGGQLYICSVAHTAVGAFDASKFTQATPLISTFAATLLDDADAATARVTLGLGNVDNTSDATKNAAAATLTNKTLAAPVITGSSEVSGTVRRPMNAVAALNIDLATGTAFSKTITGASAFTFSNPPAAGKDFSFKLKVVLTSGSFSLPAAVIWPGSLTPLFSTGKTHLLQFSTDDGGAVWRAACLANYSA